MYTHGDLFGNIGGFSLAFYWAGFDPGWYLDVSQDAATIHRRHFPECSHYGNIFDYDTLPYVDVITAGFPCQPFSYAGKRRGKDDPRYLVPKMMELLMEVKPRVILFENTPGFPALNDGAEFRGLLRTLARNGYDAEWDHLRASDYGAPHIRKRWFCVAYANSHRQPEPAAWNAARHEKRHDPACKRGGEKECRAAIQGGKVISYAPGAGQTAWNSAGFTAHEAQTRPGMESEFERCCEMADSYCERELQPQGIKREFGGWNSNGDPTMGDTARKRQQRYQTAGEQITTTRQPQPKVMRNGQGKCRRGPTEPRLVGAFDGIPDWLDALRWPSPQGLAQYDWEPPRTTIEVKDRAFRVERLGLAIVPQVVYPIALSIYEWLEEQDRITASLGQDKKTIVAQY